jgi:hypothetical protein
MITVNDLKDKKYTEEELERHVDDFTEKYWGYISRDQTLSEPFIEKHNKNKINWFCISIYQDLSEPFIEKHKNNVDWYNVSKYQILSEPFIIKYKDLVYWYCISEYQNLSENFILNNLEYIDIEELENNKHVPKELLEKVKFMKELQL